MIEAPEALILSEQINQTILKIHDIQEQQLQYMAHAQEFTQTMQEQLRDTLLKLEETNDLNILKQINALNETRKGINKKYSRIL